MKILLITTHLNFGGISSYALSLARKLKEKNHDVWVASSGGALTETLKKYAVPHLRINIRTKSELSPKVFLTALRLLIFIKENKIEIIHAQTRVTQVTASFLSKLARIPYVTTCHGFFKPKISRKICKCWGDKVIAISEPVRAHLVNDLKVPKNKIELIYNGIELKDFSHTYTKQEIVDFKNEFKIKDGPVVGIIARLSLIKGHKYLLTAAKEILKTNKDAQFIIIGDGPEKKNLLELSRSLKIENNIYFIPSTLETKKPLSVMDIFVMPSLQEGLGISILEAMACGLPVVASNVGGIYSLIKDGKNGFLVPPKDPESLKEAILKLLNNKKMAESFGVFSQEIARDNFSLDKLISKVEEVYKKTIDKP